MWKIVPGKSVGPFSIGHTPTEYLDILTGSFKVFRHFPDSEEIYSFREDAVHLMVDSENNIIQISVFRPHKAYLGDIQILDRPIQQVASDFNSTKYNFDPHDIGLESLELGIVLIEVDEYTDGVEVRRIDN